MRRIQPLLFSLLFFFLSLPCAAQTLLPVIELSAEESATARQLAQALKDAKERTATAKAAWQQFHQLYQAAHPNLPNLRFSEDFRFAVSAVKPSTPDVYPQLATVELTAEERQKLQALHRELMQSEESQKQADDNWKDFKVQLVLKHIGKATTSGSVGFVRLSTGVGIPVPNPWAGELAFTPDFKLATPQQ